MPNVVIFPSGPNECRVVPARVRLDENQQITWLNLTGDEIAIFVPNADNIFTAVSNAPHHLAASIAHNAPHNRVAKGRGAAQPLISGRYPYSVYCKLTNSYAQGNSEPDIDVP